MNNINGFHHLALKADDYEQTIEFYVQGLNFDIDLEWEMDDGKRAAMVNTGNENYLEIFEGREKEIQNGAYLHLAFSTSDCEQALTKAQNAGAEITQQPQELEIPSEPVKKVKIAFCKGPDGEIIEFFEELS
ncbi:MAG: VOC family protein [Halanaerobiales bacterium]